MDPSIVSCERGFYRLFQKLSLPPPPPPLSGWIPRRLRRRSVVPKRRPETRSPTPDDRPCETQLPSIIPRAPSVPHNLWCNPFPAPVAILRGPARRDGRAQVLGPRDVVVPRPRETQFLRRRRRGDPRLRPPTRASPKAPNSSNKRLSTAASDRSHLRIVTFSTTVHERVFFETRCYSPAPISSARQ